MEKEDRLAFKTGIDKTKGLKKMLMGQEESGGDAEIKITFVPLELIDPLESFEHPFEKSMLRGIEELAEKIKISGVLEPLILRQKIDGRYETLAGHRRETAARIAGLERVPSVVRDVNDDEAKIIVTDTNLGQRDEILPSERAKAYQIQIEALKNQGKRTDLIRDVEVEYDLWPIRPQVRSRDVVAQLNHTSAKQVSRYLKINELIEPLRDLVDEKRIALYAAVELSYLRKAEQQALSVLLGREKSSPGISIELASELRRESLEMELTGAIIATILHPLPEEDTKERRVREKPVYAVALKKVSNQCKRLNADQAKQLAGIDADKLEQIIMAAIEAYLREAKA